MALRAGLSRSSVANQSRCTIGSWSDATLKRFRAAINDREESRREGENEKVRVECATIG